MLKEFDGMDWKGFGENRESGFRNTELVYHAIMWRWHEYTEVDFNLSQQSTDKYITLLIVL